MQRRVDAHPMGWSELGRDRELLRNVRQEEAELSLLESELSRRLRDGSRGPQRLEDPPLAIADRHRRFVRAVPGLAHGFNGRAQPSAARMRSSSPGMSGPAG